MIAQTNDFRMPISDETMKFFRFSGINLDKDLLENIYGHFQRGIDLALTYFGITEDTGLKLVPGHSMNSCYCSSNKSIFLGNNFLKDSNLSNLNDLNNLHRIFRIGSYDYFQGTLLSELTLEGAHEGIHHLQHFGGVSGVNSNFSPNISSVDKLFLPSLIKNLADYEVEARLLSHEILSENWMPTSSDEYDRELKSRFPRLYGKPLDFILEQTGGRLEW